MIFWNKFLDWILEDASEWNAPFTAQINSSGLSIRLKVKKREGKKERENDVWGQGNFLRSAVLKMAVLSTSAPLLLFAKGWEIEAEVQLRFTDTHTHTCWDSLQFPANVPMHEPW